jgi:hypothetical protein
MAKGEIGGRFDRAPEPVAGRKSELAVLPDEARPRALPRGHFDHEAVPNAASALVWNRMLATTFLPATASEVLPVDASISAAPSCTFLLHRAE